EHDHEDNNVENGDGHGRSNSLFLKAIRPNDEVERSYGASFPKAQIAKRMVSTCSADWCTILLVSKMYPSLCPSEQSQ
ncbi:MAG: hypothetical protein AAGE61_13750, partial [Pseudomonadota bacterium]